MNKTSLELDLRTYFILVELGGRLAKDLAPKYEEKRALSPYQILTALRDFFRHTEQKITPGATYSYLKGMVKAGLIQWEIVSEGDRITLTKKGTQMCQNLASNELAICFSEDDALPYPRSGILPYLMLYKHAGAREVELAPVFRRLKLATAQALYNWRSNISKLALNNGRIEMLNNWRVAEIEHLQNWLLINERQ